jgi:transposase
MISVRSGLRILVTASPVDFRRGMDSLAMLVTETLRGDPFCGDLFVPLQAKRSSQNPRLGWHGFGFVFEAT